MPNIGGRRVFGPRAMSLGAGHHSSPSLLPLKLKSKLCKWSQLRARLQVGAQIKKENVRGDVVLWLNNQALSAREFVKDGRRTKCRFHTLRAVIATIDKFVTALLSRCDRSALALYACVPRACRGLCSYGVALYACANVSCLFEPAAMQQCSKRSPASSSWQPDTQSCGPERVLSHESTHPWFHMRAATHALICVQEGERPRACERAIGCDDGSVPGSWLPLRTPHRQHCRRRPPSDSALLLEPPLAALSRRRSSPMATQRWQPGRRVSLLWPPCHVLQQDSSTWRAAHPFRAALRHSVVRFSRDAAGTHCDRAATAVLVSKPQKASHRWPASQGTEHATQRSR